MKIDWIIFFTVKLRVTSKYRAIYRRFDALRRPILRVYARSRGRTSGKCPFVAKPQLHAGRRLFAMAIINACNRVGGLTRLSRARHSSVVEVTHKNCKEQRRCFSHLWCSFSKPQDRQGDWCSVQGRRLHFWRFPFPIFCPCFFLSSSLWGIKKRQGKKVENLGTKSDEQASNDPAWMSKVQKPLCLIHFWVIPFLPFSAIAPYSLWGNKKLVLPVWKFKR